jgi:hypothetical protein
MLFDLTFPCYLTTFSGKKCLSGKVICAFFLSRLSKFSCTSKDVEFKFHDLFEYWTFRSVVYEHTTSGTHTCDIHISGLQTLPRYSIEPIKCLCSVSRLHSHL